MIGSRKGRTALLLLPPPRCWTSSLYIQPQYFSKYITSKFLSTHNYLYRLHCKMDKEFLFRGVTKQHHSTSRTSYRIMGVSYRQTSFGHGYHGFWQSLHHCVVDMSVFGVGVCVWMFLWRVRLQRGQSFAAKCFIFRETLSSNYMNCICKKGNRRC